ncbi:MAG: hypothetical protein HRU38_21815 [Saccharospirillaceae bacterium]|nr:hypothetical protein [Saccharospirillaceae bacterium]
MSVKIKTLLTVLILLLSLFSIYYLFVHTFIDTVSVDFIYDFTTGQTKIVDRIIKSQHKYDSLILILICANMFISLILVWWRNFSTR